MKYNFLIVISLSVIFTSCSETVETNTTSIPVEINSTVHVPNLVVSDSLLQYNKKTSLWKLDGQLYSGFAVSFHHDSIVKEKTGFLNGRKQNESIQMYSDGHYKQLANYHEGKLHGEKQKWSADSTHVLIAQLNYHLGKAHGEQKLWYTTGELYKKLNLNMGQEEGIQQAFRKNGDLYANYEAKEGRIFGLKKAALCFGLEDENIQYEK